MRDAGGLLLVSVLNCSVDHLVDQIASTLDTFVHAGGIHCVAAWIIGVAEHGHK